MTDLEPMKVALPVGTFSSQDQLNRRLRVHLHDQHEHVVTALGTWQRERDYFWRWVYVSAYAGFMPPELRAYHIYDEGEIRRIV